MRKLRGHWRYTGTGEKETIKLQMGSHLHHLRRQRNDGRAVRSTACNFSGAIERGSMRLPFVLRFSRCAAIVAALTFSCCAMAGPGGGTLLKPDQLEKLLPATVYYGGQTASIQLRNAGGVRFSDGHYVLARLVDTSGYSSNVAAKYQGYLITEVPLTIAGKRFAAGAYGIGFVSGDRRTHAEITSESVPWHIHRQAAFEPEPRQYSRPWGRRW